MDAVVCDSSSSDSQEAEIKTSVVTNNSVDLEKSASTGSPSLSSSPTQKGFSPTIIEQAFNVMKNLFSPDKSRSKSSSILSPNNNQVNTSPYNSIYAPNKTDLSCSEGDVKIKINVQQMESNLNGDNVGLNQLGLMSASFQHEAHNTTDDSFTTTVSRIDESFQSTITHIDENSGHCKDRESGASIILNDSQDLGILNESSNETLENSQTNMDSTMLKNGGFELELKEITENLENTHVTEEIDTNSCGSNENTSGNSTMHETSSVEKYHSDSLSSENLQNEAENKISQSTYDCLNDENNTFLQSKLHRQNSEEKFSQKFDQQSLKESEEILDEEKETNLTSTLGNEIECGFVENNAVENLFVNTTFEGSAIGAIESSILKNDVSCSKLVNQDSRKIETLLQVKKDVASEISCNEKVNGIENTISTTTIVLDSVGSADFNKMLKSLKQDDSSVTSFEGSDESCSLENIKETEPKGKSQRINCDLSNTPAQSLYKISNCAKACSRSLGSSFNKSPRLKRKMSKSVDLDSSKSPKSGKKLTLDNKKSLSSADLSKFEGVEKIISLHPPSDERMSEVNRELKTILSPFVLNVEADKVNLDFENSSQFDFGNSQAVLCPEERDSVSVMSQQSYTVLTSLNKNLERPVIKSDENLCGDFKEDLHSKKYSPSFRENADKENVKTPCDKVKTLRAPKNSSPNGEVISITKSTFSIGSTQTYVKPTSSAMKSSCFKKESCVGLDNAKGYSKADLLSKAMKIFSSSEDPSEITNIVFNDSQFAFDNSETQVNYQISNPWVLPVKCFRESIDKQTLSGTNQSQKLKQAVSSTTKTGSPKSKLNVTFETNREPPERRKSDASVSNKLNQTYDKKSLSPEAHELNQTYDKKSESPTLKFNQTYDKNQESPTLTLNQTYDKKQESPTITLNQTYEKKQESAAVKLNETYDKRFESPKLKMNETFEISNKYPKIEEDSSKTQETNSFEKKVARVEPTQTPQNVEKTQETEFSFIGNLNSPNEKNEKIDAAKNFVDSTKPLSSNIPLACTENLALPTDEGTQQLDELIEKVADANLSENFGKKFESEIWCDASSAMSNEESDNLSEGKSSFGMREGDELFQLIQEQFSPTDIEKICSVVEDIAASKRLSSHILRASQEFDKSFHESFSNDKKQQVIDALTPQGLEYLDSIKGKPSGRDFSRESLYVKFDPLVQIPPGSTLIDFTKEGEILPTIEASPKSDIITNDCEHIFSLSPKNKSDGTVPPLTPLSSKKNYLENEKEKLKNLQNEIYFLKNMYAEREKVNQSKLDDFEAKVTKLTGENCVLEDRLKSSKEREKSLVKKLNEQTESINKLKCVMEEYVRVIQKLSDDYDVLKTQSAILVKELSTECNSFKEHLQNTEAAFSDVHAKYERSKKTISNLKANETMFKRKITEQSLKLEEYKHKVEEAQEKACQEFMKIQEQLSEAKKERNQETTRLRAQLRKAELKLETLQESLDQKIKENQELTAICDELIEGKK